jgi:type IV pilus biogenesis protein CpaD/CtpE
MKNIVFLILVVLLAGVVSGCAERSPLTQSDIAQMTDTADMTP